MNWVNQFKIDFSKLISLSLYSSTLQKEFYKKKVRDTRSYFEDNSFNWSFINLISWFLSSSTPKQPGEANTGIEGVRINRMGNYFGIEAFE